MQSTTHAKTMNSKFLDRISHLESLAKKDLHTLALDLYHKGKIEIELAEELGAYEDIKVALLSCNADFIKITNSELENICKTLDFIEELINE